MKKTSLILILMICMAECKEQNSSPTELVTNYYKAKNATDYNKIKPLINDSITITEGDYIMPYDHDSFYEVFKWDSIFQPTYEVIELEEKDDQIIASVTINSLRNTFLKNKDMTCQFKISFESNKISKIESLDCVNVDWGIWQQVRDSLVSWITQNHPELDGFINDMTMNGAINYIKAIELYEAEVKGNQ